MALFRKICKIYLVQQVAPKKSPEIFLNNMLFPWLVTRNDRYALVIEIRVDKADKKEVRLSGSYNAMAGALHMSTKHEHLERVPSFVLVWLPSTDSNRGPSG